MPWGSRPSMAALTRSGARKASEIVMLTLRTLHPSRLAIISAFAGGSAMSPTSQRRARAIDATSVARFSERMRRACCGGVPWANDSSTFKVNRPIEVVVLNCWVTDTKDTSCRSNSSTSLAKSASERVRRSIL